MVWCDTDEEGGPELKRSAGGVTLLDHEAWSAWLIEHEFHDLSLVAEGAGPHGLPYFRANRGGIQFQLTTEDVAAIAAAWSDYRKEYGVSPSKEQRVQEHEAFKAGWAAARGQLDAGGVQR